jgi:TolB-like protein/Tfp pilus assembly protein PilF
MPQSTPLQRLKERKLVQWALAYLAGAWVLAEAADVIGGRWNLPDALYQGLFVLLGVGFFVTLVLAWYHGEQGRQRVSGPELLMVAALLVVAGAALALLPGSDDRAPPAPSQPDTGRPSIAVLPLDNFSPDPADAYFADGMQEQLVSTLAKIGGLSVRGRTSVMRYREHPKPLPEIAEELGVRYVIEGSVRITGGQVSFTAQLLDAVRDEHLWADEYDRAFSVDQVVSIHREIAGHVVGEVQAVLTPEEAARIGAEPTASTAAYEEYLRGQFRWRTRSAEDLEGAVEHFQRAIQLDPDFALAYAGLAGCYAVSTYFSGDVDPSEMFRLGENAAEEALRLSPDLAAAHAALGFLRMIGRRDWEGAEASLRQAIALDPEYAQAHHWLANYLGYTGRFEEAYAEAQEAIDLDPLNFAHNHVYATLLYAGRRFDAAKAQYRHVIDLFPDNFLGWAGLAEVNLVTGNLDEALRYRARSDALFGIDSASSATHLRMASTFHRTGTVGHLPPAFDTFGDPPDWGASSAMWVGDTATALTRLEQASAENWPDILAARNRPLYDPIRDHPRFQALIEAYFAGREPPLPREP